MAPSSSLPADAHARLAALASAAREASARRDADRFARLAALTSLGDRWLAEHAESVCVELTARVAAVERLGLPPSLFTLMGLSRYERPYNAVLAWIVGPGAPHGAGRAVLRAIASLLDLDDLAADARDPGSVFEFIAEQTWPEAGGSTGQPDLVVLSPSFTLLIENKVHAEESGEGQYAGYLAALRRLAESRGTPCAAFLAAPHRRTVPGSEADGDRWNGAISHADLASALRVAADDPLNSAWGRVACLLAAQQLEFPGGADPAHRAAVAVLQRAGNPPAPVEVAEMRHLLAKLHLPPTPGIPAR